METAHRHKNCILYKLYILCCLTLALNLPRKLTWYDLQAIFLMFPTRMISATISKTYSFNKSFVRCNVTL